MLLRLLAIVTLVCSPLLASAAAAPSARVAPAQGCDRPACCETVRTMTCCGATVTERVCSRTGGACECSYKPGDRPAPERDAPQPRPQRDLVPAVAPAEASSATFASPPPARPRWASSAAWRVGRTHNDAQALLGVWRT